MGKVTFLGVEGSGKTVLTMALVNAFKRLNGQGLVLRPDSRESYRFLVQQAEALEDGELPGTTTQLKRLAWTVVCNEKPVRQMDVLDYAGEIYRLAFLDAGDEPDPAAFKEQVRSHEEEIDELLEHLTGSDQVFVLFNLDDAKNQKDNPKNLDAVWVTNACLDYLHRLPSHPRISLVLTQMDRFSDLKENAEDERSLFARYLPLIANNFPHLPLIPVSALSTDYAANGIDAIIRQLLPTEIFAQETEAFRDAVDRIRQALRGEGASCLTEDDRDRLSSSIDSLTEAARGFPSIIAEGSAEFEEGKALLDDAKTMLSVFGERYFSSTFPLSNGDINLPPVAIFRTGEGQTGYSRRKTVLEERIREKKRIQAELLGKKERQEKYQRFVKKAIPVQFVILGVIVLSVVFWMAWVWVKI